MKKCLVLGLLMLSSSATAGLFSFFSRNSSSITGSGIMARRKQDLSSITCVKVGGVATINIVLGDRNTLEIEADDNVLPLVHVKDRRGVLSLKLKGSYSNITLRYKLVLKQLDALQFTGACNAKVTAMNGEHINIESSGDSSCSIGSIHCSTIAMELSGSSYITIDDIGTVEHVDCKTSGFSQVTLKEGYAQKQDINVSGSCVYNALGIETTNVMVNASGASHIAVFVQNKLKGAIAGNSVIEYKGNPLDVGIATSGLSSYKRIP